MSIFTDKEKICFSSGSINLKAINAYIPKRNKFGPGDLSAPFFFSQKKNGGEKENFSSSYTKNKIGPGGLVVMMEACGAFEASSIPAPGPYNELVMDVRQSIIDNKYE